MSQVIALVGATASGKSAIAVELAPALGAEIVSCDSMQVYRHMPILAQAPTYAQRAQVPHHLVECVEPIQSFSVGDYRRIALPAIAQLWERRKPVLIVGGTGLYLKALTEGLCEAPPADQRVRQRLWDECGQRGPTTLHHRLRGLDAVAASRIHPHDARRIIRALEVYALTGRPISSWWREASAQFLRDVVVVGIDRDRDDLYARINARLLHMVYEQGVINEARRLLALPLSRTARQVHGLADVERYLSGELTLKETIAEWQKRVRNYARRQLIWFRQTPDIQWVRVPEDERPWETAERVRELVRRRRSVPLQAERSTSQATGG